MSANALADALSYRQDEVVHRFLDTYGEELSLSLEEAEDLFLETKRWLWLCATRIHEGESGPKDLPRIPLLAQIHVIDLMWHTFLLYTADYAQFCERHLGTFVHHVPRTRLEKLEAERQAAENPEAHRAEKRQLAKVTLGYVHDRLGPETLRKWFEHYPRRFSRPSLEASSRI